MYNTVSYLCLILCVLVLSRRSLQLPVAEQEVPDQLNDISKIVGPGNSALEENDNDPPVYIMVPVVGERSRRGAENGNVVNLDNVSYEVPTFIKFNESAKGDIEVSLIPSPDNHVPAAPASSQNANANGFGNNGSPGSNGYCPPLNNNNNNNSLPMKPICLTLNIEGIIPPGKKVLVSNSSEIKGSGAVLRIRFTEAKDDCRTTELLGAGLDQALRQRLDTQKKKKFNDEDDEEDSATTQQIDQKSLQELIFKILTSNKVPSTTAPTEEIVFLDRFTTEPSFSFLINPSILQKISGKRTNISKKKMTTLHGLNSPDFDTLLKTVEHITSTMPKEKLLSLLSSLINKAALNKEMSTNQ